MTKNSAALSRALPTRVACSKRAQFALSSCASAPEHAASSQQRCALCGKRMRADVRCRAAQPAPTQLRVKKTWRLAAPLRAAAASRVAQGAARRCRLDQGCAAWLVAAVAAGAEPPRGRGRGSTTEGGEALQAEPLARRDENAGERVAGKPAWAEPPKRKRRAPKVGEPGETTPDGKPKPDERTVADLVRRGWFKSEAEAVALLTRGKTGVNRYAFETAELAADWLEATLGAEPVKDGLCPAAKAVKGEPSLLIRDAAALQCKWDALTLSSERGGMGIELSTEQARKAVSKYPQLLGFSLEKYKACWTMLTATENGLDLPLEEARKCILRAPTILLYDNDDFGRRVKLLQSLGYADARTMVLANSNVLNFKEETVTEHAAWWKQTGLDHVKLVSVLPTLLGSSSTEELQAKLDFMSRVAGMSNDDLNNAGSLFHRSLDGRLRTRFFYALMKQQLGGRYGINSLMQVTDAAFLAMMLGGTVNDRASKAEVARYQKLVASAGFVAWRKRQEARLLRSRS